MQECLWCSVWSEALRDLGYVPGCYGKPTSNTAVRLWLNVAWFALPAVIFFGALQCWRSHGHSFSIAFSAIARGISSATLDPIVRPSFCPLNPSLGKCAHRWMVSALPWERRGQLSARPCSSRWSSRLGCSRVRLLIMWGSSHGFVCKCCTNVSKIGHLREFLCYSHFRDDKLPFGTCLRQSSWEIMGSLRGVAWGLWYWFRLHLLCCLCPAGHHHHHFLHRWQAGNRPGIRSGLRPVWTICHWIGLRENLQETMVFTIKYRSFL